MATEKKEVMVTENIRIEPSVMKVIKRVSKKEERARLSMIRILIKEALTARGELKPTV